MRLLPHLFFYTIAGVVIFAFMNLMLNAWDKEYENQQQYIQEYKADLAKHSEKHDDP